MRETSVNTRVNPEREPSGAAAADQNTGRTSPADLNNQLYRAYLAGDGAAVERILGLIQASADAVAA